MLFVEISQAHTIQTDDWKQKRTPRVKKKEAENVVKYLRSGKVLQVQPPPTKTQRNIQNKPQTKKPPPTPQKSMILEKAVQEGSRKTFT